MYYGEAQNLANQRYRIGEVNNNNVFQANFDTRDRQQDNYYMGNVDEAGYDDDEEEQEIFMFDSKNNNQANNDDLENPHAYSQDVPSSSVPTEGLLVHVEFNIKDDISRITSTPTESDLNFSDEPENRESENIESTSRSSNALAAGVDRIKEVTNIENPLLLNKGQRRLQQPNFAGTVNLVTSEFGTYYVEEPGDTGGEGELYRNESRNRPGSNLNDINRGRQAAQVQNQIHVRRQQTNQKFILGNNQRSQVLSNQFSSSAFKGIGGSRDNSNVKMKPIATTLGGEFESAPKLQPIQLQLQSPQQKPEKHISPDDFIHLEAIKPILQENRPSKELVEVKETQESQDLQQSATYKKLTERMPYLSQMDKSQASNSQPNTQKIVVEVNKEHQDIKVANLESHCDPKSNVKNDKQLQVLSDAHTPEKNEVLKLMCDQEAFSHIQAYNNKGNLDQNEVEINKKLLFIFNEKPLRKLHTYEDLKSSKFFEEENKSERFDKLNPYECQYIKKNEGNKGTHEIWQGGSTSTRRENGPLKSILKMPYVQPKINEVQASITMQTNLQNYKESIYQYFLRNAFTKQKSQLSQGDQNNLEEQTLHDPYSLYVFKADSCFRLILLSIVDSKKFEYQVMFIIFLNSISLAFYDYSDRQSKTSKNQTIDTLNTVCTGIFAFEALMKIIAYGLFLHRNSYLRNAWNIIDAVVVISGIMELGLGKVKLKALRVIRVFRPFKSITAHKGLKKLVATLLYSLSDFANVATFLAYIFLLFAIMGLHQYSGTYNNICRYTDQPIDNNWEFNPKIDRVCTQTGLGTFQCPNGMVCGNHEDFQDLYDIAKDQISDRKIVMYGLYNFDNIWSSLLTVFMIINSDTWYQHMINMMDADIPIMGAVYCIFIIVVGQFFLINLILAVIIQSFIKIQKHELEHEICPIKDLDSALQQSISLKKQGTKRVVIAEQVKVKKIDSSKPPMKKHFLKHLNDSDLSQIDHDEKSVSSHEKGSGLYESRKGQVSKFQHKGTFHREPKRHNSSDTSNLQMKIEASLISSESGTLNDFDKQGLVQIGKHQPKTKPLVKNFTFSIEHGIEPPTQEAMQVYYENQNMDERAREFDRKLKRTIEEQYRDYFKNILREAQLSYQGPDREEYVNKANLREIVGLKVGLQIINNEKCFEKEYNRQLKIEWRATQKEIYNITLKIAESSVFSFVISIVIILNLVVLCLDRYPENPSITENVEKLNIVFTMIYIFELLINLCAVGVQCYYQGQFSNIFDSIIVLVSIIDLIITGVITERNENATSIITAIRGFRLLRVFKLAKNWLRFGLLLEVIARTLVDVSTFLILIGLFIFSFTLLGMELFAHDCKFTDDRVDPENGDSPRYNFDTFINALFSVLLSLTNDATTEIWLQHHRAVDPITTAIYFLLLIILGQRLLLNVFLAILLQNFDEGALRQKMLEFSEAQQDMRRKIIGVSNIGQKIREKVNNFQKWLQLKLGFNGKEQVNSNPTAPHVISVNQQKSKLGKPRIHRSLTMILSQDQDLQPILEGSSLNFFPVNNKMRQFFFSLVTHQRFEQFINLIIIISAVQLALDTQSIEPNSNEYQILYWIDVSTTCVFIFEALIKIVTFGLFKNGMNSYFRRSWNIVNFTIIAFSIVSLTPLSDDFNTVKIFRVFRLVRWISRSSGLQTAVKSLVLAIPNVMNIVIIFSMFLLVFGVITVSYFKGRAFTCDLSQLSSLSFKQSISKWECLSQGGEWKNRPFNFDNSINSAITLFILSTSTYWGEIILPYIKDSQIDYTEDPTAPFDVVWLIFFSLIVIIGLLFFLNLFVGVVISTFNAEHDRLSGIDFLTEQQKEWINTKLMILKRKDSQIGDSIHINGNRDPIRMILYKLQSHQAFDKTIMFFIILNMVVLCIKWNEQPNQVSVATEYLNYLFTGIFVVEIMIKMFALGCKQYLKGSWNIFDLIIIIGSFVSIFISANSTSFSLKGVFTIMRSFRVLRLLRLIKRGKSLQIIFNTILITLKAFSNIGALLLLVIFIYTVIGMLIFGNVKRSHPLNDHLNFEAFPQGFITLFIVSTGDSWNLIMHAFSRPNSPDYQCIENPTYQDYVLNNHQAIGCGNQALARTFFLSYIVLVNLVFLKIFIAVILQGHKDTQALYENKVNTELQDNFIEKWKMFDPKDTSFIRISKLRAFLTALGSPMGFDGNICDDRDKQDQFIASLDLPTYNDFSEYQQQDVMDALTLRIMILDKLKKENVRRQLEDQIQQSTNDTQKQDFVQIMVSKNLEQQIKSEIKGEINRLLFSHKRQDPMQNQVIYRSQNKALKEQKQERLDIIGRTSQHQILAEQAIQQWRKFIERNGGGSKIQVMGFDGKKSSPNNKIGKKFGLSGKQLKESSKKGSKLLNGSKTGNKNLKGQNLDKDGAFFGAFDQKQSPNKKSQKRAKSGKEVQKSIDKNEQQKNSKLIEEEKIDYRPIGHLIGEPKMEVLTPKKSKQKEPKELYQDFQQVQVNQLEIPDSQNPFQETLSGQVSFARPMIGESNIYPIDRGYSIGGDHLRQPKFNKALDSAAAHQDNSSIKPSNKDSRKQQQKQQNSKQHKTQQSSNAQQRKRETEKISETLMLALRGSKNQANQEAASSNSEYYLNKPLPPRTASEMSTPMGTIQLSNNQFLMGNISNSSSEDSVVSAQNQREMLGLE